MTIPSLTRRLFVLLALLAATAFSILVSESGAAGRASGPAPAPATSCVVPASWTIFGDRKPQLANSRQVLSELARRDVVLLGEEHDDADHHRWQSQVLAGLHAQRPEMVIDSGRRW